MRKPINYCLVLLLTCAFSGAQGALSNVEKLASLCKVWGFLKYYHPVVAKGKHDWDKQLMDRVSPVLQARDKQELNSIYSSWMDELGDVKERRHSGKPVTDSMKRNFDISWMDDKTVFTDSVSAVLHYIERNKRGRRNYYVRRRLPDLVQSFRNEEKYEDSVFPSVNMRILSLCRYWNIIEYYFPYKYVIGEPWGNVLNDMIPEFLNARDTLDYIRCMQLLLCHTHDSHAGLRAPESLKAFWQSKTIPVQYKIIEQKAVVTDFFNDTLAGLDDLKLGDVIVKVNGKTVPEIVAEKGKFVSASNEPTVLSRMSTGNRVTYGMEDTVHLTVERDGIISEKTAHRYFVAQMHYKWKKKEGQEPYKLINDKLGYLDLDVLKRKQVKSAMKKVAHTDALIIDVRNYPSGTMFKIARHLKGKREPFAKFTIAAWKHPGMFKNSETSKCGRKRRNIYKGKVILLFNEETQSHAEFTCMALKTALRVTGIGSQTAGADGNVTPIYFPGGYSTYMTGLGVYYPDWRPTQRIGIVPDIKVTPTIKGIRMKKDEVLERAIQFANTGK